METIREAPFGQLVRWISGNRVFLYPEERHDFVYPVSHAESAADGIVQGLSAEPAAQGDPEEASNKDVEQEGKVNTGSVFPRALEAKTEKGVILVDWYTPDDPSNPQNWSSSKKAFAALQICLYTFVVYCGSAIFVPSESQVMDKFGEGNTKASLGLALYVLAYGVGPLLWSPLSEMPFIGRNIPYITTFFIFVILCIPTALVDNMAGLLALRFLQGLFGSPCLASGGASMQDMYSRITLPLLLTGWVASAYCGPALGPLISSFAVEAESWRWSMWEILWMSGPVFGLMFFFLPETSADNILLRRAQRLRHLTGNANMLSQSEMKQKDMAFLTVLSEALIKPLEIMFKDPALLFTNVYTSLVYGIYYSFFEVFPLVYPPLYGFSVGETGITFVCIFVACLIAMIIYVSYLQFYLIPDIRKHGFRSQESRLAPALFAVFGPPVGLFLFGWTARSSVHWIVSVIGITIYAASVFIIMQCIFVYVPLSYPQYAASLFAGNDFSRSAFAFASILFSRPMYQNLGIGQGISVLGGLSVLGIIGMFVLYSTGAKLRARSSFAVS